MSQPTTAKRHDAWLRRLSDYHSDLDGGALPPTERAAIEAHLRTCDECQRALDAYMRLYALLASPLRLGAPGPALARQDRYFTATSARSTQRRETPMPPYTSPDDPAVASDGGAIRYDDTTTRPMQGYPATPDDTSQRVSAPSYPPYASYPSAQTPPTSAGGRAGRRPRWGGVAAALVAALLIIAFAATLIPRILATTGHGTPTATAPAGTPINKHIPTPTGAPPTLGPTATTPPAPTGFVCANAPGSHGVYAFLNTDLQLYSVTGCAAPQKLTNIPPLTPSQGGSAISAVSAIAFSPANTMLMIAVTTSLDTGANCQYEVNLRSDALTQTPFCTQSIYSPQTQYPAFAAWLDDNTFLESVTDSNAHVRLVRVDATSFAQTTITTFPWVANLAHGDGIGGAGFALRNGALFYAGYADGSTTQAALRRYSLADGSDRQITPLGIAGYGGCQVTPGPCGWTGPWDVSPDGAHIIYHNPGPQISLSDTQNPPDTPLFYANSDGSGATRVFAAAPPAPNAYVTPTTPVISPNGAYAAAANSGSQTPIRYVPVAAPNQLTTLPPNLAFASWRPDSSAMLVLLTLTTPVNGQYELYAVYTLVTGNVTMLTGGTSGYVWGN